MSPGFQLQLEEDRYTAGDTVKGTILVTEGGGSRSLEVRLEFVEETDDYLEVPISVSSGQLHAGGLTQACPSSSRWRSLRTLYRATRPTTASSTGESMRSRTSSATTRTRFAALT